MESNRDYLNSKDILTMFSGSIKMDAFNKLVKRGLFPKPLDLGIKKRIWKFEDVKAYFEKLNASNSTDNNTHKKNQDDKQ